MGSAKQNKITFPIMWTARVLSGSKLKYLCAGEGTRVYACRFRFFLFHISKKLR